MERFARKRRGEREGRVDRKLGIQTEAARGTVSNLDSQAPSIDARGTLLYITTPAICLPADPPPPSRVLPRSALALAYVFDLYARYLASLRAARPLLPSYL